MKLPRAERKVGFLKEILDKSPLAFVAWNTDSKIISFNSAFCQISGYSENELRSRQTLNGLISLGISDSACFPIEKIKVDLLHKSGRYLPVEVSIHPVRNIAAKIDYFFAFLKDPDESWWLKRQLELALSAGNVATWHWDLESNKVSGDETLRKFFHVSEIEADFNLYVESIHPEDRDNVLRLLDEVISSDRNDFELEFRIFSADTALRWVISRGRVERENDGKAICTLGVVLDITDKKLNEQALRESEFRYRNLVEMSPDAIYVNQADRIVFVNPATCKLFAADNESLIIGKSPSRVVKNCRKACEQYLWT